MSDELLLTSEVAKILKCNLNTVNDYIKAGLLPRLKIGRISKCRRLAVEEFMKKYEGYDLTDPYNVKPIEEAK
ncbi:DNA binding domain-containing protein, excisionase family [Anaerosporobacter mobilis DSM 15930]|jgi:excisionase family DNA binding protein|uniref:DNA binding domain-containing protein, excisionase family n=1 Tax=Anaerosporobacter mobilis DSM 15930 TaxID=1120996 RepID=A0A1M7MY89_9FIRM|nr:helix-turn-helix domain-containing protein [Anaerosporobacter mobilis]SHM96037.1 DNA binding domain-containing protein, excisionase family [Anaerosporobacter mobilis DSM 15930]